MSKGKSKTTGRTGSQSNNNSRASGSDRQHDEEKKQQGKSIKLGTENSGKLKEPQGGVKR